MKIYSPNFFKDDFTENKNYLKNPNTKSVKKDPFSSDTDDRKKNKNKSFSSKAIDRINKLKEYFSLKVTEYFNEEVQ